MIKRDICCSAVNRRAADARRSERVIRCDQRIQVNISASLSPIANPSLEIGSCKWTRVHQLLRLLSQQDACAEPPLQLTGRNAAAGHAGADLQVHVLNACVFEGLESGWTPAQRWVYIVLGPKKTCGLLVLNLGSESNHYHSQLTRTTDTPPPARLEISSRPTNHQEIILLSYFIWPFVRLCSSETISLLNQ